MALSCTYQVPKYGSTSLCDQNCDVQSADTHTHTHTNSTRTDRQKKTEGPEILSNDIVYFKTVMIGGPITLLHAHDIDKKVVHCALVKNTGLLSLVLPWRETGKQQTVLSRDMDARFGTKVDQIGTKWDKSGDFKDRTPK